MGWGVKRTYRRVTAALALLGIAYYTFLLPGHLTSQFNAELFAAEYGTFAGAICTGTPGAKTPGVPGAPPPSCPFCKGLAAFQLAVATAPQVAVPIPVGTMLFFATRRDHAADAVPLTPRSRGPPLPA
jgi:hypothetical protein